MEWINDIKERISRRLMRNTDRNRDYVRDFIDLESAKQVGLIINSTEMTDDEAQIFVQYAEGLKKRGKQLLIIELNFVKKSAPRFTGLGELLFVEPAGLKWSDYPGPQVEAQVKKYELDILMDFDHSPRITSRYLCSLARARTRTGVHREGFESCYELMINRDSYDGLKAMIREFDYFLNMIDNGKRVKAKA
ncbi:MAG: hypothetical protein NW241_11720 [Bacteroidia bacterium]|nr:hypothetical protein [Bacteroidia bacterium]